MRRRFFSSARLISALVMALLACVLVGGACAATVTDDLGNTVTVPDAPKRVYALSPPDTLLVFAIKPCLLVGWNTPKAKPVGDWCPKCLREAPVVGGYFGQGMTPNKEAIIKAAPELVISGTMAKSNIEFDSFFTRLGIPVVHLTTDSIKDYPHALRALGKLLGQPERGEKLAAYGQKILDEVQKGVASIPANKRLHVYYAEGADGLYTDGANSFHTQLISMAGGINVHPTPQSRRFGMDKVTMETVIGYAPQVILAQNPKTRAVILKTPTWKAIPAVQQGRVPAIPNVPVNWFDRPPSFMRFLGLQWLAHTLYPEVFPYDMVQKTQEFFKIFWNRELTKAQAQTLLGMKASRP